MNQSPKKHVYLNYDQTTLDLNYNQAAWATNAEEIIAWYRSESLKARARLSFQTYAYGVSGFERIDFFPTGETNAPLVVYVHGGAWRSLDRMDSAFAAGAFVGAGVNFAILDFASIPNARLPDMVDAVGRGIGWLADHAGELGFDVERLIVVGHSSGAHLVASALALTPACSPLAGYVKAALCASGAYDLQGPMLSARGAYLQLTPAEIDTFSPVRHVATIGCPLVVAYGERETDEYRRHALEFHTELQAVGVVTDLVFAPGLNHFEVSRTLADRDGLLFKVALSLFETHEEMRKETQNPLS